MKTEIFVMTHKAYDEPTIPGYRSLQVGKALNNDLGYLGDDTGDSISKLNPYYGELTGLYWLWKNYHDTDIIGVCHYRRFFVNENRELLTMSEYENELSGYDIMVSNGVIGSPCKEGYASAHNINDLLETGEVLKELYPEDYPAFCEMLESTKTYFGNLCVMKKELFDDYCEWLFTIFSELENRIDVSTYDDYHKRVFGFISETMLLVFIKARNLKVKEGNILINSEKAETIEFKLAMTQLVKLGQFSEARQMYYDYLKIRPDILLSHSDILNEIPDIELIIYILEEEKKHGIDGLYKYSQNLKDLIKFIRQAKVVVKKEQANTPLSPEEATWKNNNPLSEIAVEIIKIN